MFNVAVGAYSPGFKGASSVIGAIFPNG